MKMISNALLLAATTLIVILGIAPAVIGFLGRALWCGFVVGMQLFDELLSAEHRR